MGITRQQLVTDVQVQNHSKNTIQLQKSKQLASLKAGNHVGRFIQLSLFVCQYLIKQD